MLLLLFILRSFGFIFGVAAENVLLALFYIFFALVQCKSNEIFFIFTHIDTNFLCGLLISYHAYGKDSICHKLMIEDQRKIWLSGHR